MVPNLDVSIRRLDGATAPSVFLAIGALHTTELSAGFLSQLGPPFLAKLYRFLATDHYVFAAFTGNQVIGFMAGTADASNIKMNILPRLGPRAFLRLAGAFVKPASLRRATSLWAYLRKKLPVELPKAELLSVAISPEFAHQGIGSKLARALESAFAEVKIARYKVAASETQVAALGFYRKLGGREVGLTDLGGLKTHLFIIERPALAA